MKKINEEKGAITILVLITMLFFLIFLVVTYVFVSNKANIQSEATKRIKEMYSEDAEEIYNSYFGNEKIIPIYTVEHLFIMGNEEKNVQIKGRYYNFSNNENTVYVLMNDLKFKASDYEEELVDGYWIPIGEKILAYEQGESGTGEEFKARFEGEHSIEVIYTDDEDDEYSVIYSEKNDFCEPEYEVKFIPRIVSEDGEIASNATVWKSFEENSEFKEDETANRLETGEIITKIKRIETTQVMIKSDGYKNSEIITIFIENPKKIDDYTAILGKYSFTINQVPTNAVVTINGQETNSVYLVGGETAVWKVELEDYVVQEGNYTIEDEDVILDITLKKIQYTLTIEPTPSDASVTISTSNGDILASGTGTQSVEVDIGTILNYSVNRTYYYSKTGTATMNSNSALNIELESKPEQTIRLTPTSVSGSYSAESNGLNDENNSDKFAFSLSQKEFIWYFDTSSIDPNAKITGMNIKYRLGTAVLNHTATMSLKANGNECFSTTTESITLDLAGEIFENTLTEFPSASDINAGLTLSAIRTKSGIVYLRCYGSSITINYIEP